MRDRGLSIETILRYGFVVVFVASMYNLAPKPSNPSTPTKCPLALTATPNTTTVKRVLPSKWDSVPPFDLICRTYSETLFELMRFMFTYTLFWPYEELKNKIIIVVDEESKSDRVMAAVIRAAWRMFRVEVFFEKDPPLGTLTAGVRNTGYSRTQWSNFYSDLYTGKEYVGIFDSDVQFTQRPNAEDLFDQERRPVIHMITDAGNTGAAAEFMVGAYCPGNTMMAFPFFIKVAHLPLLRAHVAKTVGVDSFEQAWGQMQLRFPAWGQFAVIGTYLWHHHQNEYSWRLFGSFPEGIWSKSDPHIQAMFAPTAFVAKHLPMTTDPKHTAHSLYQHICAQSEFRAVDCSEADFSPYTKELMLLAPWTDYWPLEGGSEGFHPEIGRGNNNAAQRDWKALAHASFALNWNDFGGKEAWMETSYQRSQRTVDPSVRH